MKVGKLAVFTFVLVAVILMAVLAFGNLAHALLPHDHSNSSVTSLLHAALRHEDKTIADAVPPAPFFVSVIIVSVSAVLVGRALAVFTAQAFVPAIAPLRRGVFAYRRFS